MTMGLNCIVPAPPVTAACYPLAVRQVYDLPYTAFGFHLTMDTLVSTSGSGHLGPQGSFTL